MLYAKKINNNSMQPDGISNSTPQYIYVGWRNPVTNNVLYVRVHVCMYQVRSIIFIIRVESSSVALNIVAMYEPVRYIGSVASTNYQKKKLCCGAVRAKYTWYEYTHNVHTGLFLLWYIQVYHGYIFIEEVMRTTVSECKVRFD